MDDPNQFGDGLLDYWYAVVEEPAGILDGQ